jgi:hypothetical protein
MSSDPAEAAGVLDVAPVWRRRHEDAGFDLTPAREGNWIIFRSSAFPQPFWASCGTVA